MTCATITPRITGSATHYFEQAGHKQCKRYRLTCLCERGRHKQASSTSFQHPTTHRAANIIPAVWEFWRQDAYTVHAPRYPGNCWVASGVFDFRGERSLVGVVRAWSHDREYRVHIGRGTKGFTHGKSSAEACTERQSVANAPEDKI